jgi:uncharacterized protein YjbJ (UPF0337 family)
MGNAIKRTKGAAKEAAGTVEKKAGQLVGSERVEARGRARELEGKSEQEAAKARERTKGKVEEVAGKIQKKAGDVFDDDETMAKGKLREVKGQARQKANQ